MVANDLAPQDAIQSYESIMDAHADAHTGPPLLSLMHSLPLMHEDRVERERAWEREEGRQVGGEGEKGGVKTRGEEERRRRGSEDDSGKRRRRRETVKTRGGEEGVKEDERRRREEEKGSEAERRRRRE